jgi:tRNA U34 5-carboxymethylaminomethyl modifying GTPase MnmE/TrmE
MSLLNRASQPNPAYQQALQHLLIAASGLQHNVEHELPVLLAEQSTHAEYFTPAVTQLQQALTAVKQHIIDPTRTGKTVVAFGGAFSAGKSSLINALIGEKRLQVQIDPTTSVPTYVCAGESEAIHATNVFQQQIKLSAEEFAQITHDEQNPDTCISGLLRSITLQTPKFTWQNLVVLDTPGYSKPAQGYATERTDADIAHKHLNTANFVVWVVSAAAGGVSEDELDFLKRLNADIPKLIVISRADTKTAQDLSDIQTLIQKTCTQQHIDIMGIVTTSARKQHEYPLALLTNWLDQWDINATSAQQKRSTPEQNALPALQIQLRDAHDELAALPIDAVTTLETATQQQHMLAEIEQALEALCKQQVDEKIAEFQSIAQAQAEENRLACSIDDAKSEIEALVNSFIDGVLAFKPRIKADAAVLVPFLNAACQALGVRLAEEFGEMDTGAETSPSSLCPVTGLPIITTGEINNCFIMNFDGTIHSLVKGASEEDKAKMQRRQFDGFLLGSLDGKPVFSYP